MSLDAYDATNWNRLVDGTSLMSVSVAADGTVWALGRGTITRVILP